MRVLFDFFINIARWAWLRIAGTGRNDYIDKLVNLSRELLGKNSYKINFIGAQSPKDIRSLMSQAQALIVASRCEGFGRMSAEAALHHCLVIGKKTGGTEEIINLCGGLGYTGGSGELAQEMEFFGQLSEQEKREAFLEAIKLFTNEASAKQVCDYYNQILLEQKNR